MSDERRLHGISLDAVTKANTEPSRRTHQVSLDVVAALNSYQPNRRLHEITLDVVVRVLPGIPINLEQIAATSSTVTLTWDPSPSGLAPESYEWKMGESGAETEVLGPPLVVYGLPDPGAIYTIYIRSKVGSRYSGWASINVSPTVILDMSTVRRRRFSDIHMHSQINTLVVSASRPTREVDIGFEQGIIVRFPNMRVRRKVTNIQIERPTISIRVSSTRRRRNVSFSLEKLENNFLLNATRRRRSSSMELSRPAASISLRPYIRPRRQVVVRVLASTYFLTPNVVRRRRVTDFRFGPAAMSISGGIVRRLHTDGVWRPLEIVYKE